MLYFLFVLAFSVSVSVQQCPPKSNRCPEDYRLLGGGLCVRILEERIKDTPDNLMARALAECGFGAYPPIIMSDTDNDLINKIYNYALKTPDGLTPSKQLLGLVCNQKTRRLEWADGSKVDYTKNNISVDFDCTKHITVVSEPAKKDWQEVASDHTDYSYTVMCVVRFPTLPAASAAVRAAAPAAAADDACWDYNRMDTVEAGKAPCYKLKNVPNQDLLSWTCAEQVCENDGATLSHIWSEEENKFYWRTAVANSILGGMHIGMHSKPGESTWKWIDDDSDVNTGHYTNYINGFPLPDPTWKCGSMQTNDVAGSWVNIDCDTALLYSVCRREEYAAATGTCPTTNPLPNSQISPPGFPPNVPCDYLMVVDAGKRVQLTIDFFESNECCDFLYLFDGPLASPVTALGRLQGADLPESDRIITTVNTNVMLASWQPDGARNVRGFRMHFEAVDPPP